MWGMIGDVEYGNFNSLQLLLCILRTPSKYSELEDRIQAIDGKKGN